MSDIVKASLMLGWKIGRIVAAMRGKGMFGPAAPKGIYDDEFPIQWNSLAVQENVSADTDFGVMHKVSNLTPTLDDITSSTLTVLVGGTEYAPTLSSGRENLGFVEAIYTILGYTIVLGVAPDEGLFYNTDAPFEADFTLSLSVTASQYLYGTPAPYVVTYNGVELPDIESVWTDKETYELAFICYNTNDKKYILWVAENVSWADAKTLYLTNAQQYELTDDNWVFVGEYSAINCGVSYFSDDKWANFDLLNYSGDGNYFTASDPVYTQTGGNVAIRSANADMMAYNGVTLPDIETVWTDELKQTHPYVYLVQGPTMYYLYMFGSAIAVSNGNVMTTTANSYVQAVALDDGAWHYLSAEGCVYDPVYFPYPANYAIASTSDFSAKWANTDVLNAAGTTYLAASDPEPAYNFTYYNGAVLPNIDEVWTDKETYPYAYVFFYADVLGLCVTAELVEQVGGNVWAGGGSFTFWELSDGAWKYVSSDDNGATVIDCMWTSEDLITEDGELYLAATDPIPITGDFVGYSYNGTVLPDINTVWTDKEAYPYAYMYESGELTGLILATTPTTLRTSGDYLSDTHIEAFDHRIYMLNKAEVPYWMSFTSGSVSANGHTTRTNEGLKILWSNHDVVDYDDATVTILPASNPVSVYDQF